MEEPRRIPPAALIAAGVVVVALVGILGASYASMRKKADGEMCAANLRIIFIQTRSGEPVTSPKWAAAGTGRAFLASYPDWPTHEARPLDLNCPVKGPSPEIDYRGPVRPLHLMERDEPILADRPGNHGPGMGGNVVLKSGALQACTERDPLWAAAARSTSD